MSKMLTLGIRNGMVPVLFILLVVLAPACQKSMDSVATTPADALEMKSRKKDLLPEWPLNPADFVTGITNPYLAFEPGKTFYYESQTDEGLETVVVEVTHDTRTILGVVTTVVHDREYLDGELVEDTYDWFAQDKYGNVWYFGEDTREYEDGVVISTEGSWEAGVDGAMPGIIMPAEPRNGLKYQQEFYEDAAEDWAQVVNVDETVTIGLGTFTGVLETMEWTPLEPGHREHKFYEPGLGLILELSPRQGGQRVELVAVSG